MRIPTTEVDYILYSAQAQRESTTQDQRSQGDLDLIATARGGKAKKRKPRKLPTGDISGGNVPECNEYFEGHEG